MSFMIRLEGIASARPPQEEIAELPAIASRLGLPVAVDVNGFEAFAVPGEPALDVIRRWEDARASGGHRRHLIAGYLQPTKAATSPARSRGPEKAVPVEKKGARSSARRR